MDSIPVVAITGQVGRSLIGTDAFQESDITGITMPITKHNILVRDGDASPVDRGLFTSPPPAGRRRARRHPQGRPAGASAPSPGRRAGTARYKPNTKPHGRQIKRPPG